MRVFLVFCVHVTLVFGPPLPLLFFCAVDLLMPLGTVMRGFQSFGSLVLDGEG
jgi:hypothetical protein